MTSSTDTLAPLNVPRLEAALAAPWPPVAGPVRTAAAHALPDWSRGGPDADAHARAAAEAQWQRGFDEGRALGEAEAATRLAPALAALEAVAGHLAAIADTFARDRERDLHALAIVIARGVVQRELASDPAWVTDRVTQALERLPLDAEFRVRLNPEDHALLGADLDRVRPAGRAVDLAWLPDASIARGDFVVETPHRLVDGRADVLLRSLYDRLDHD